MKRQLLCFFTSVFGFCGQHVLQGMFRVYLQFNKKKCISKCPHHFNAVKENENWLDTTPLDLVYPDGDGVPGALQGDLQLRSMYSNFFYELLTNS